MLELKCPLDVVTPKGKAVAHFLIDYGCESDLYFVCFIKETRECWTFKNKDITLALSTTENRT